MRRLARYIAVVGWLSLTAGPSAVQAAWTKIYAFEKSGSSYDVVLTLSGDSLNDLFLNGYDGTSLGGFASVLSALDVGTGTSTAALQDHLVRGMLGLSGYDPFSNPGRVIMVYAGDVVPEPVLDYRYLESNSNGSVSVGEVYDWSAAVAATAAYEINRGPLIPEPSTALLLGLGLIGLAAKGQRRNLS